MFRSPHFPGAAEADQDLVGDEQRAGLGRDLAHRVDEVVRRNDVAGRALHRLDDDRGDLALRVVLDDIAQMLGAGDAAGRILKVERAAVTIGVGTVVHARREWPLMVAIGPAEKPDHALRLAVEAAPEADELELLGGRLREPEGRLDRFRAAREKLEMREPFRQRRSDALEELRAGFGGETAEGDAFELLLEPRDIARMRVAEAADSDAGDEVEIFVAVDVGDRAALRVVDDDLREERDRLQAGRHRLRLAVEDRLRLRTGHGAARKLAPRRVGRFCGRKVVQGINSSSRRQCADAAGSARSGGPRSPRRPDRGKARSSATR